MILALFADTEGDGVVDKEAGVRWAVLDGPAPDALLAHEIALDPGTPWIVRHDRVEFQPGGIAHRHTHPGPGIRYLLRGEITIDAEGEQTTYGPGGAWFESGPEPVLATTSATEPTAFARVLLLPAEWEGKRTIAYVDPADAERPKTQKATIISERPLTLPR